MIEKLEFVGYFVGVLLTGPLFSAKLIVRRKYMKYVSESGRIFKEIGELNESQRQTAIANGWCLAVLWPVSLAVILVGFLAKQTSTRMLVPMMHRYELKAEQRRQLEQRGGLGKLQELP